MTEPLHHLGDAFRPRPVRQLRTREHDHGKAKRARGVDLGARAVSSGIAGDDPFDAARLHHLQLVLEGEGAARHNDVGIKRQRTLGRINEPQCVGVLRPRSEGRDMLPADGEKHPGAVFWQSRHGRGDIGNLDPVVAGRSGPWSAFEHDQRRSGVCARRNRIAAHLGRERMGRVDHMCNALATDVIGKATRAAKAADTGRQRLVRGCTSATAVGVDRVESCARHVVREQIGIGGSAQNEGAYHG